MQLKPVTQERILKALSALFRNTYNNKIMQQGRLFMECGMKSKLSCLTPSDSDRLDLELQFINNPLPASPEEFSIEHDKLIEKHLSRQQKILDIQIANNVSGLEWESFAALPGKQPINFPFFNDMLKPTDGDAIALKQWKTPIVEYWADCTVSAGLAIYKNTEGGWDESRLSEVGALSPLFDWANIWSDNCYLSPRQINSEGWDTQRSAPECRDDELFVEIHLVLGRGKSMDCESNLHFCAANHWPAS